MKISVVMTTFNGEKYIESQMLSIFHQSKEPDEVLVFDDLSHDRTTFIINEFIKKNRLTNWKLCVNSINLGWKKNFMQGISHASGDVVFLADQDDLWHKKKIEKMIEVFEKEECANLVVCNYTKFRDDALSINLEDNPKNNFFKQTDRLKKWNIPYPGCTYAIKKNFFDFIKSQWNANLAHDFFIYEAAWLSNSIYVCDVNLHYFRRHEESVTTNAPILFKKEKRLADIVVRKDLISSLMSFDNQFNCLEGKKIFYWLSLREKFIKEKSLIALIKLLCSLSMYNKIKTFFADCYATVRNK